MTSYVKLVRLKGFEPLTYRLGGVTAPFSGFGFSFLLPTLFMFSGTRSG